MNNLDFSVIVLCYNPCFESLLHTIISIVKQEDVSFEIIICDDGSKIDYEDQLRKWIDSHGFKIHFKFVFNKKNQGTIANYLSGLNVSTGKYIKPISPGDYLFDEKTLKQYKFYFENKQCDILFSDAIYYSNNSLLEKRQYPDIRLIFKKYKLKELYCVYGYFFLGATICSRREILIKYMKKVKNKVLYLEDYSLITMALLDGISIFGIESPCIWYEYGNGISTNSSGNLRIRKDSEAMRKVLLNNYPNNKIVKDMILFNKIREKKGISKYFGYIAHFPKIFYYKFLSKTFYKQLKYFVSIDEMKKMINMEEKI